MLFMDEREYENIFRHEPVHFYYQDTHALICDLVRRYAFYGKPLQILDAGCGTGFLSILLKSFGDVKGIDISKTAIRFAKKRGVKATLGTVEHIPYNNGVFDVIVSIDVLYHKSVRDDVRALSEFYRILKPGGFVILRLPAISWLRRCHDAYVGTARRYDKQELVHKLQRCGFSVRKASYVHGTLFIFALGVYLVEKLFSGLSPASNISSVPQPIHGMMRLLLRLERLIARYIEFPIGLGLVAVAEKP